jgi:hypothetical protein
MMMAMSMQMDAANDLMGNSKAKYTSERQVIIPDAEVRFS